MIRPHKDTGRHKGVDMKSWLGALLAMILVACAVPATANTGERERSPELVAFLKELRPRNGTVAIPEAKASLDLGTEYDFYDRADAAKILVQLWGNPPESAEGVLGLVMPAGVMPDEDSWGAVVTFEDSGYVSDDDADEVDYDDLLDQLKEQTDGQNEAREQEGYPAINLVGWAERPDYDASSHSVVWAQNLAFAGNQENTLNYDVRSLGRYGVLSLNLVSTMGQLEATRKAAHAFARHAQFDRGARYQDYNASTDRVAEYGVGGLVAAGAGLAAAKKLGLFAILLKFLKPLALALFVGFAVFRKKLAALFGRTQDEQVDEEWAAYAEGPSPDVQSAEEGHAESEQEERRG